MGLETICSVSCHHVFFKPNISIGNESHNEGHWVIEHVEAFLS